MRKTQHSTLLNVVLYLLTVCVHVLCTENLGTLFLVLVCCSMALNVATTHKRVHAHAHRYPIPKIELKNVADVLAAARAEHLKASE